MMRWLKERAKSLAAHSEAGVASVGLVVAMGTEAPEAVDTVVALEAAGAAATTQMDTNSVHMMKMHLTITIKRSKPDLSHLLYLLFCTAN